MAKELTEAEAAVYDRQLRVWGLDTQQKCVRAPLRPPPAHSRRRRLSAAHVAVVGMTGVTAEVRRRAVPAPRARAGGTHRPPQLCKNIALAGVGRLTLLDDRKCDGQPSGNFLVPLDAAAGSRRAPAP